MHIDTYTLSLTMKFPITREILQAYDHAKEQEEVREDEIQKTLTLIVNGICAECKKNMLEYSKEKRFVWRGIQHVRQLHFQRYKFTMDEYLPQFIEKLQESFIGCDIIIDPLKTYLIIDWS